MFFWALPLTKKLSFIILWGKSIYLLRRGYVVQIKYNVLHIIQPLNKL